MSPSALIIYHADCPDGFGAALAAWRQFGPTARYLPLHHGQDWNFGNLDGVAVYIFDFALPPETLRELSGQAASVLQMDHHVSARAQWNDLLTPRDGGGETYCHPSLPLQVVFDLDKSGAHLAWEHLHPDAPLPPLLAHIEDIDLWRFALPGTRAFMRALRLLPVDFTTWEKLLLETGDTSTPRYREMLAQGTAIESFFEREVERLAHSRLVMPARLAGEPVDALQLTRHGNAQIADGDIWRQTVQGLAINADALFTSELGHRLAERSGTFGLIWQLAGDGEIKASLRAAGQIDVAEIASRYGGGGHRNAAGFRMAAARFFCEILGLPG